MAGAARFRVVPLALAQGEQLHPGRELIHEPGPRRIRRHLPTCLGVAEKPVKPLLRPVEGAAHGQGHVDGSHCPPSARSGEGERAAMMAVISSQAMQMPVL